jgi:hypothetical protein
MAGHLDEAEAAISRMRELDPTVRISDTGPLFTGSAMYDMTMGIVALAFLAACTDGVFMATITSNF